MIDESSLWEKIKQGLCVCINLWKRQWNKYWSTLPRTLVLMLVPWMEIVTLLMKMLMEEINVYLLMAHCKYAQDIDLPTTNCLFTFQQCFVLNTPGCVCLWRRCNVTAWSPQINFVAIASWLRTWSKSCLQRIQALSHNTAFSWQQSRIVVCWCNQKFEYYSKRIFWLLWSCDGAPV